MKHRLILKIESDATPDLKPVEIYANENISQVLYYAMRLLTRFGISDYRDWVKAHKNHVR